MRWFRLAAEQGLANAQFALGAMYVKQRARKGRREAVRLFRLAAEQGLAEAQFALGEIYAMRLFPRNGTGVLQNNVKAYVWLSVAAAQGYEKAITNRDIVSERLTTEQLARGQELATRCLESDYQDCE